MSLSFISTWRRRIGEDPERWVLNAAYQHHPELVPERLPWCHVIDWLKAQLIERRRNLSYLNAAELGQRFWKKWTQSRQFLQSRVYQLLVRYRVPGFPGEHNWPDMEWMKAESSKLFHYVPERHSFMLDDTQVRSGGFIYKNSDGTVSQHRAVT